MTDVTPDHRERVLRLMEDALDSTSSDEGELQRLADRGEHFKKELTALIDRFTTKHPDFANAREILGDDFLAPEEIAPARGFTYSKKQLAQLKRTLPGRRTLKWLRRNGFMLVAGPPHALSLAELHARDRGYFCGNWYHVLNLEAVRNERVTCRWYMLRKDIVPNSTYKRWDDQKRLLSDLEEVPMAVELAWSLICYKAVRGAYLFQNVEARTSTSCRLLSPVSFVVYGEGGLSPNHKMGSLCADNFGVASARKS